MSYVPFNAESLSYYKQRVNAVTPETMTRWGKLTPPRIFCHMRHDLNVSLGKERVEDKSTLFTRTVLRYLIFHIMPDKKNIVVPGQRIPEPDGDLEKERAALLDVMDEFVQTLQDEPDRIAVHELVGPRSLRYWTRIHGKHFDHHLKQLGV